MSLKRLSAVIVVALVLPYACAPIHRFPQATPFAGPALVNPYRALAGAWQRSNFHAHGRAWFGLTNGRQDDEEVVRAYRDRGYSVPGISDYFSIAANHGAATIAAYEHGANVGKHHQVAIGARYVDWFDFPFWQGPDQKQYVIDRVKQSADLVALAHPSIMPVGYSARDLAMLTGYQLFEVVNGRFTAEDLWDAALSAGRPVWALASDDTHDITDPDRMAVAWMMVDAPSAAARDVLPALGAGRSYAVLRTSAAAPDATDSMLSSVTERDGVVTVTCTLPSTIAFVGRGGRELSTAMNTSAASYTVRADDSYVRAVIRTPHTTMYLNPVVRSATGAIHPPEATVDAPKTWAMRGALIVACAALLLTAFQRRPGDARGRRRYAQRFRRASSVLLALAVSAGIATNAAAQQPPEPSPPPGFAAGPALGSTLTFDLLRDLPTSDNLFSVFENVQAETVSDRFTGGGLNFGTPARFGAFGSSWTQTRYRIGDVNVTDGATNGAPLFFPETLWWDRVSLATGVMPADLSAPGAAITLEPRRPGTSWTGEAGASTSFGDSLTAKAGSLAQPIATAIGWNRGSATASGPLTDRLGLFAAASLTGASRRDGRHEQLVALRAPSSVPIDPTSRDANVASAFAHLVFARTADEEIRTVGIVQRRSFPDPHPMFYSELTPARDATSAHIQSTWSRSGDRSWRAFAAYSQQSGSDDASRFAAFGVDRLSTGPIPELVDIGDRTDRRWSLGGRVALPARAMTGGRHTPEAGLDLSRMSSVVGPGFTGSIVEDVDVYHARIWQYIGGAESRRHTTTFAVYGSDRIEISPRLSASGSLRYEWVGGRADGSQDGVAWNMVLPRADIRWTAADRFGISLFAAYGRAAYELPVDALAWGDPASPSATIFRAPDPLAAGASPLARGPLVGRWGPGTGGDPGFSSIDPNLKRPYSDTISLGVEARPFGVLRVQFAGVAKWEKQLLGVVNRSTAAPVYKTVGVNDPGLDLQQPTDDQILPVASLVLPTLVPYGYQYSLTNPSAADARLLGVKFAVDTRTDKLFLMLGATAYMAEGVAANQGFLPAENDQGTIGEAFVNPNTAIYPRGRLFNDRAFTIRLTTIYKLPWDIRAGAIARYQDGQPFSRLVLVPGLTQGAEAVRAFANGGWRFTFTGTLDLRLQKEFPVGSRKMAIVLDGYNILNLGYEVEERVITGPAVRTPTAIQPPATLLVGARLIF